MKTACQPSLEKKYTVARHWRKEGGWYMAVVKRIKKRSGGSILAVLHIDSPISVEKHSLSEEANIDYNITYDLDKACRSMIRSGKHLGITKAALNILEEGIRYAKEQNKGLGS